MITVLVENFVRNEEFRRVKGTNVKYLKMDEIYLKQSECHCFVLKYPGSQG